MQRKKKVVRDSAYIMYDVWSLSFLWKELF